MRWLNLRSRHKLNSNCNRASDPPLVISQQTHARAIGIRRAWLPRPELCLLAMVLGPYSPQAGSILREVWYDLPGSVVSDLTSAAAFPNQPSETNLLTDGFEAPIDVAENYGQRIHGYILPPVTGNYTFWVASDDGGELWLSSDEKPANQRLIANVAGWTSSQEWTVEPNQESAPIRLEANRPYYIAALQKEASGGDNLAVRWLRPDGVDEAPIPATYLLPWGTVFSPPRITQQPASITALEGGKAEFTLQADPLSPATVQWQRNTADIPGAVAATLSYGPVTLADQNGRFRAVLSNQLGTVTSTEAVLTVTPDVTPPSILSVLNMSTTRVRVTFSEPVEVASATRPGNFALSGGVTITAAALQDDARTVALTTSALSVGSSYALTSAHIRDRAASPNTLASGPAVSFTAVSYVPVDIGSTGGKSTIVPDGLDVSGIGADFGGTADQGHFAYEERTGDFDIRVRIARLSITDPYVQGGLMAREDLTPSSRFAGVFSSSAQLGCFFETRTAVSGASQMVAPNGSFPANYPQMWLRLRRSGNQFTGFGSLDGQGWQQLGAATVSLPSKVVFGMAVASHSTNALATAEFRDIGAVANPVAFVSAAGRERLGPSSRRSGVVVSEIMYHPAARVDGKELEFVELYNSESIFVDLSGWRLSGAIQYAFPPGFRLQAGQFAVVAADPAVIETVYGIANVLGPYTGRLNNAGDTIRLRNAADAVRFEVDYSPDIPWPLAADGLGHSLVLAQPSYGESDPRAWKASEQVGGSPGEVDAIVPSPWTGVVINEYLAHTDDPVLDFIELYNATGASVNLSGCFLSDEAGTNRFRIPAGSVLGPRGFLSFDQHQLGFALNAAGETIYLLAADQSRVLDVIRFSGQENGVSSGRSPDGAPTIRRLNGPTPGGSNTAWRQEDVVISEVMYHAISGDDRDQYVELHNLSLAAVSLSGWRLRSAIAYQFPPGASIAPGDFVVVAKDAARMGASYPQLNGNKLFGDFSGALSRSGERLTLSKPDAVVVTNDDGLLETNIIHIVVSEVSYRDGGRWPELADGGGSSLELIDPHADLLRASNWRASDETSKGGWKSFEVTGRIDLTSSGNLNNRLQIVMQGAGECLIDDIEVFRDGGTNLLSNGGFENSMTGWTTFGNHRSSSVQNTDAVTGQNCLHVRSSGDGDTGNNTIRANLASQLLNGQIVTIRAKVRWLSGWPEVLLRIRGNGLELPVRMDVPGNLGTPGAQNSRQVSNAGPAIFEVSHSPALPRSNEAVLVTCRVSDPDGVAPPRLRFRVDPASTLTTANMRDDGTGGDALAGDGLYTATISGRAAGALVAFRIEATDDSGAGAGSVFPADAPSRECLIRWDDPVPFGSFAHYHLWSTVATEQARGSSRPLDNTYRDCTLVYGNSRIIYNAGFRDKGSPYHGGSGDFAVAVPTDDLLLGAQDRVFGSTGNGGSEGTGMKGDVSAWIGQQMGIPYLHSHYMRLFRNGSLYQQIMYDLEQPNRNYAQDWFGGGEPGDELYKIAVWFEFSDDNSNFQANGATLSSFQSGGAYKLARYRWNWQLRPSSDTANNYTPIFNLVTAANNSADRVSGLMNLADMEEWMRVFAFNRVLGNWDAWTFNVGQNMYLYAPLGARSSLMPWDVDFVLGDGNGPTDALWGGQDPVANQLNNVPAYRRMLWRAFQDAVRGPMQATNYTPQVDARRAILLKNGVTGLSDPRGIRTYLEARRNYIQNQLNAADTQTFALTTNGGADVTTDSPTITLTGTAPFAVAVLEINGIPYPVSWTGFTAWRVDVPLGAATNRLQLTARDLRGEVVPGATATVNVRYTGAVAQPQDWVVLNEVMYHPVDDDAEFIELYNRHPTLAFDLSGWQLSGADFTFPPGSFIASNAYLVVVKNRAAFAAAFGSRLPVAGEFNGRLDNGGETLRLVKPFPDGSEIVIDDLRYDSTNPWPTAADGLGPSLQLIDPAQDNWRAGNWTATAAGDPNQATPGRANAELTALEPFPNLWINEVLPANGNGATDNQGEREPWIELYNAGSVALNLSGYYLGGSGTSLTEWPFPAGVSVGPRQFLLIWADGQPSQSIAGSLHTSFRLNPTNGVVTLSRTQPDGPGVVDYASYRVTSANQAFGSVTDGEPRKRRVLLVPTPGAPNNPNSPTLPVYINEWLANNRRILADPADGDFDDWFELFNAGASTVDLSGFFLTGNLTNKTQFRIPDGTLIPPGGYRLFWADEEINRNAPGAAVHVDFRLPAEGGQIGLYGLDESLIDSVTFGPQTADVSQGRFPDGTAPPSFFFALPTPGAGNSAQGANRPPVIEAIADVSINQGQTVSLRVVASDPDASPSLAFDLVEGPAGVQINSNTGDLTWVSSADVIPGVYPITVRVTDNGTPVRYATRTFQVTVVQVNQPPSLAAVSDAFLDESAPFRFQAVATDLNLPPQQLTFALGPNAPAGAAIDPISGEFTWTPAEEQGPGTYAITFRVTDNGQPPLSAERTFTAVVREVNNPPLITQVSPQTVDEGAELLVQIEARDPDTPPAALTYSIENSPLGVSINPTSGLLKWVPSEADGPHDYQITVRVAEPDPARNASMSFLVGVREVNTPPVLEPLGRFRLKPGDLLVFTNRASDVDLPRQTLSFASETLPLGASLDQRTGVFRWAVPADPVGGTNLVVIRVTDDAVPAGSTEATLTIVVETLPRVVVNEIMHRPKTAKAEYVELANYSANNPVDLSGWRLEGYDFLIPAGTVLPPSGYVCIARDLAAFRAAYGESPRALGNATVALPVDGGLIRLVRPAVNGNPPEIWDEVKFELAPPWPSAAREGASLQLIDPLQDNTRVANWAAATGTVTNAPVPLVTMTGQWRYWQSDAAPGDNWKSPVFNDASWPAGAGLLYVETANLPAAKSTPLTLGRTTYYFRTRFTFDGNPDGARLRISSVIDDGAVFYLNGQEIFRLGMAEGAVTDGTFANRTVGDAAEEGPFDLIATGLKQGENVLAVEVHQINATSSDIVFGCSVAVLSESLASFTPGARNSVAAELSPFPLVWINELMPENTSGLRDNAGDLDPWIELFQAGSEPLPLAGWALSDDFANPGKWVFPAGSNIGGPGYLLIWADGEAVESTGSTLHTNFRLPQQGSILLSQPNHSTFVIVDYITYTAPGQNRSWGSFPDGKPLERQVLPVATPGAANSDLPAATPILTVDLDPELGLQIGCQTSSGRRYQLQVTTRLDPPQWNVVTEFVGDGARKVLSEAVIVSEPQRYYRVVAD